jgi:F-box domain
MSSPAFSAASAPTATLDTLPVEVLYSILEHLSFYEQFYTRAVSHSMRVCVDECGMVRQNLQAEHGHSFPDGAALDQSPSDIYSRKDLREGVPDLVRILPRRYAADPSVLRVARLSPGSLAYCRLLVPPLACRHSISELWLGVESAASRSLPRTRPSASPTSSTQERENAPKNAPTTVGAQNTTTRKRTPTKSSRRVVLIVPTDEQTTAEASSSASLAAISSSSSSATTATTSSTSSTHSPSSPPTSPSPCCSASATSEASAPFCLEEIHLRRYVTCVYLNDLRQLCDLRGLENLTCVWLAGCTALRDLTPLANVHHVDLSFCNVTDLSALRRVHSLTLSHCDRVRDLSCLTEVHTLRLEGMDLRDVTVALSGSRRLHTVCLRNCRFTSAAGFSSAHNVNLSGSPLLEEVNALAACHTVKLNWCPQVRRVRALGSVHTLELGLCKNLFLEDVAELGGVCSLTLDSTLVSSVVGLGCVHTLSLLYCMRLGADSAVHLAGVHTLNLNSCRGVLLVDRLGGVHTLDLTSCFDIPEEQLCTLGGVHTLILDGCSQLRDVSRLGRVHTLNLDNCYSLTTNPSALAGVHTLRLPESRRYRRFMRRAS